MRFGLTNKVSVLWVVLMIQYFKRKVGLVVILYMV